MPLPIPLGGISASSETIPHHPVIPQLVEYDTTVNNNNVHGKDGDGLSSSSCTIRRRAQQQQHLYQSIAFAICPLKEWQARVVTSFYDVMLLCETEPNNTATAAAAATREMTMVDIRIQISPLSCPLSAQRYRETSYQVKLMDGAYNERYPKQRQHQVVFSQDKRYLVVLLYHPHQETSTVVIFQLRKPRHHNNNNTSTIISNQQQRPEIPIPSYITNYNNISNTTTTSTTTNNNNNDPPNSNLMDCESPPVSPAVATNPKFLSVWGITAMCPIPATSSNTTTVVAASTAATTTNTNQSNDHNSNKSTTTTTNHIIIQSSRSILMAVCQDGTLVWIDLKTAETCAKGRLPVDSLFPDGSIDTTLSGQSTNDIDDDEDDIKSETSQSLASGGSSPTSPSSSSSSSSSSLKSPPEIQPVSNTVQSRWLPSIFPITSMQASPTSSLESGTVALVVTAQSNSSNGRTTVVRSSPVECILASWSLSVTKPRERTLPKRASTGTVSIDSCPRNSLQTTTPSKKSNRSTTASTATTTSVGRSLFSKTNPSEGHDRQGPSRSFSDTLQTLLKSPGSTTSSTSSKVRTNTSRSPTTRTRPLRRGKNPNRIITTSNKPTTADPQTGGNHGRDPPPSTRTGFLFRSKSMERNNSTMDLAEKLSKITLPGVVGNLLQSDASTRSTVLQQEDDERMALEARKQFLLQELQRRPPSAGQWIVQDEEQLLQSSPPTSFNVSHNGRNVPKRTKSGSFLGGSRIRSNNVVVAPPLSPQSQASVAGQDEGSRMNHRHPRRRSNPDKNDTNETWRDMKVDVLSTWSGTAGNNEGEHRHVHSKKAVVNVCFGALPTVLCVSYKSTSVEMEKRQRIAQILTISETGQLSPVASLFLSLEQVQNAPCLAKRHATRASTESDNIGDDDSNARILPMESTENASSQSWFGLDYVREHDCFVVNSIFGGQKRFWLGCIWSWRDDSLGWLVRNDASTRTLWSKLYVCQDPRRGSHFVQIESIAGKDDDDNNDITRNMEVMKRIVSMASLSPPNTKNAETFENCTLLLSSSSVGIPLVNRTVSDSSVFEIEWKMSSLPVSYLSACGPPRIAAIGKTYSKSVAVASQYGLCIWDLQNRPKWRLFGSPAEEKSFVVLGMVWWEGRRMKKKTSQREDDLLVAIIRTNTGHHYLSCWSPRRLDLGHQLFDNPQQHWELGEGQCYGQSWGIPLPHDIQLSEMSILAAPSNDSDGPRKAVLAIYSTDCQAAEFEYRIFCLQVAKNRVHKKKEASESQMYFVMAHEMLKGRLRNGARSVGPVSSIFLAGSSFRFDLRKLKKKSAVMDNFFVTIGVIRSPGGLEGVYIGNDGSVFVSSVTKTEISKVWLSDLIHASTSLGSDGPPVSEFYWIVKLMNGELACWSVPSIFPCQVDGQKDKWEGSLGDFVEYPKGLCPPVFVCTKGRMAVEKRWLMGKYCALGKSSDWIQEASSDTQSTISMGHVPGSRFGCILQAGPDSLVIDATESSNDFSAESNGRHVFCQGAFLMTPPAFVTSLYLVLLESASLLRETRTRESSSESDGSIQSLEARLLIMRKHLHYRLSSTPNKDAMMMGLRLLIFRSVELLTKFNKRHSIEQSDSSKSHLSLAQGLFEGSVDAVRCCTTPLQFASLFLEVGRQIEPSSLPHLFPLPEIKPAHDAKGSFDELRSVVDLLTVCLEESALAASASALPLLNSQSSSRRYCGVILDEALDTFVRNTHSKGVRYDATEEARQIIGDIFRFGMKLEDAELGLTERLPTVTAPSKERKGGGDDDDDIISLNSFGHTMASRTTNDDDSLALSDTEKPSKLICGLNGSNSILNYIVPSNMLGVSEKQKMEEAIRREAASFIKGSLDNPSLDFVSLPNWDDRSVSVHSIDTDINSVAGLIGDALLELLQSSRTDCSWKAMGALAHLIFPDGIGTPLSFECVGKIAARVESLDVVSILPEMYSDGENYYEMLEMYLSDEFHLCSEQISETTARDLVNMSIFILNRLETLPLPDKGDQNVMELGVSIIVLVSGHHAKISKSILHAIADRDCILRQCYENVVLS
ncbi:hypothetical protein IV203_032034 [Nitzschia inconspicua]|uniref:Uncharacterized protein n=1 Tax=Nitzschia inconspicua TaxID=303405 RepID=A0A9K3LY93_9STRA|nr:hypothetical protein IV203_032034 [Nitzschia inconspicua]